MEQLLWEGLKDQAGGFRGIAGTGEDGEARIFGEGWIRLGELAEEELRAFGGFDQSGVKTAGAKAEARISVGG